MKALELILRFLNIERAQVEGDSMMPSLRHGEIIWVKMVEVPPSNLEKMLGRVVVVEREEMPGILLIKRLQKVHGELMWIEGDNHENGNIELQHDSRKLGWLPASAIKGFSLKKSR
jgi:phage repressor protein C with HTH and peptisase S24 domain